MPLYNFGEVAKAGNTQLLRSAQPDADAARFLVDYGVKNVIRLSFDDEGATTQQEKTWFGTTVSIWSMPMPKIFREAEGHHVISICKFIHERLDAGSVLVHCLHGVDRTSMCASVFRMIYVKESLKDAMENRRLYGVGDLRDCIDFEDHHVFSQVAAAIAAGNI